jgi:ATP adenylyltransferase
MDYLWSPWRMQYLQDSKTESEGCVFCEIRDGAEDERVLAHSDLGFVVLNKYPYNPGHLIIAPNRHLGELGELLAEEHLDLQELLARSQRVLQSAADPHGFNIGMNLGRVAGAGIPDHLHWHLIPRWPGDTNFMPAIGQTRVLPELLAETYARLKPYFEES